MHGNDREIATRYLEMVGDLRLMLDDCSPSPTHYFLKKLADGGRLRRVYTQNIDDLETRAGLELVTSLEDAEPKDGYRKVVQLHGHMRQLFCGICFHKTRFRREHAQIFQSQKRDIACPACNKSNLKRQGKMRARSVGKLQTCIVLQNGGPHPDCTSSILTIKPRRANAKAAQLIGQLFDLDTRSDPDLLLIIGTSLEIKDIKSFVTRLNRNMNVKTVIMDLNWIDFPGCEKVAYHLKGPCDFFVNALFPSLDLGTKDHVSGDNIAA